jgi:hypothetical protein
MKLLPLLPLLPLLLLSLSVTLGATPSRGPYQLADRVLEPQNAQTAELVAAYAPLVFVNPERPTLIIGNGPPAVSF